MIKLILKTILPGIFTRRKKQEKKINYVWLYIKQHQNIGVIGVSARNRHNLEKGPDNF